MPYKISLLNDEIVEITLSGAQSDQESYSMMKDSLQFNNVLSAHDQPIKVLVDLTNVSTVELEAMKKVIKGVQTIDFDKLAIFGASPEVAEVTAPLLQVTEKSKLQRFLTRQEALDWLRS